MGIYVIMLYSIIIMGIYVIISYNIGIYVIMLYNMITYIPICNYRETGVECRGGIPAPKSCFRV